MPATRRRGTPAINEYFRGGGFSSHFVIARRDAGDDVPHQSGQGPGPGAANRRGLDGGSAGRKSTDTLDQRTNPTWPTTWFAPT